MEYPKTGRKGLEAKTVRSGIQGDLQMNMACHGPQWTAKGVETILKDLHNKHIQSSSGDRQGQRQDMALLLDTTTEVLMGQEYHQYHPFETILDHLHEA